jgi:hypothetical protein
MSDDVVPLELGRSPAVDRGRPAWFDTIEWRGVTAHAVEPETLVALRYMSLVEARARPRTGLAPAAAS